MISALVFGLVFGILAIWTLRLVEHGRAARKSVMPSGRKLRAFEHKEYAWKISIFTVVLCGVIPIATHFLRSEAHHPAPYWLLMVSRVLTMILIPLLAVLLFGLNGLETGHEKIHRALGWSAVGIIATLTVVGMVLYHQIYL